MSAAVSLIIYFIGKHYDGRQVCSVKKLKRVVLGHTGGIKFELFSLSPFCCCNLGYF